LNSEIKPDRTLDCRGYSCPIPVIKTRREIERVPIGGILEVISTDEGAKNDIPAWADTVGHEVLKIEEFSGVIKIYIRRKF